MKKFNPDQSTTQATATALMSIRQSQEKYDYPAYIGLDVHKETIAISVAKAGRQSPEYQGEIANRPNKIRKQIEQLNKEFDGQVLLFCYEAGPCGYALYRQLIQPGYFM